MKKGLLAFVLTIISATAFAQAKVYPIDRFHSKVGFAVKFGGLFNVEGRFDDFNGTVVFDEQDLTKLSATVTIASESIDTGVDSRDRHLKSEDFLEVEKFPEIRFSSKQAVLNGDQFQLIGDLTMHGVTREVTIPFSVIHGEKPDFWKNFRISLQGNFSLNRSDYGVGEMDDIADEVTIDLMISARVLNMQTISLFSRPFGQELVDKLENGGMKEARAHIKALQSNEDRDVGRPVSFTRLNLRFAQNSNFEKAIQACQLGIEVFPDDASLHTTLANTYYQMGELKKAREAVKSALKLDGNNSMALELKKLVNAD